MCPICECMYPTIKMKTKWQFSCLLCELHSSDDDDEGKGFLASPTDIIPEFVIFSIM